MLISATVLMLAPKAVASPILWTVSGATFTSGPPGSISGSFVYDTTTSAYSSINLIRSGDPLPFSFALPGAFSGNTLIALQSLPADLSNLPSIYLLFSPLSPAGGVLNLDIYARGLCGGAVCDSVTSTSSGFNATLTGTPVTGTPEPASLLLASIGLAALGMLGRRRSL